MGSGRQVFVEGNQGHPTAIFPGQQRDLDQPSRCGYKFCGRGIRRCHQEAGMSPDRSNACKLHVRRGDDSSAAAALGFISLTDWCSQNQGAAQGQQGRKRLRSWSPDAGVSPDAQQSPDGPEEAEVRNLKLKALAKDLSRPQSPRGGVSLLSRPASRAASRTPPPPSRSSGNSSLGPFISLKSMLGSSVQGTCASAASLSSSLGSFSLSGPAGSAPRAVCTPPGNTAAFEAHRVHVQCPAPKRPSRLSDPLAAVQTEAAG